jgi:hypothetical protein
VLTLKEQVFLERVVPVIHVITAPALSTILHEEYVQGLVVESVKYYVESSLTY